MKIPQSNFCVPREQRGVALVLVLSFVVLLTVVVVAFFSRAMSDRQVSNSSAGQFKADLLARSALDVVVGDLKQEIADPATSSVSTINGISIYTPKAAANIIPRTNISSAVATALPNLIRQSMRSDPIAAPGLGSRASDVNSTNDPSVNGRSISLARWNGHYLLPRHDTSATIDSTPISPLNNPPEASGFTPPDWVYVTGNGPAVLTTPDPGTVGRYAYAVYDEGGLLDINVAGYPTNTTSASLKGSVAFADLSALTYPIPQSPQVNNIVGWRNYATVQPGGNLSGNYSVDTAAATRYANFILNNTGGFLTVNPQPFPFPATPSSRTDQSFGSRQSLLKFRRTINFSQNALQYLGTFSREKNAPSWSPSLDIGTYPYKTNADTDPAINRNLANVRVKTAFTRTDGSAANVGEILLKKRFPLSRLGIITQTATETGSGDIYKFFGLKRATTTANWIYDHGAPAGTIWTLAQVSQAGREPDMFELLQAAILSGSIGTAAGPTAVPVPIPAKDIDLNTFHQIIRIGANIIDQSDSDNLPTTITFNADDFYGIENLPYLSEFFIKTYSAAASTTCQGHLVFELWNPHLAASGGTGPTSIRVRPTAGVIQLRFAGDSAAASPPYTLDTSPATGAVTIPSSDFALYAQPHIPNSSSGANYQAYLGYSAIPMNKITRNTTSNANYLLSVPSSTMIVLEYQDPSGTWHPYSTYGGLATLTATGIQNVSSGAFGTPICYGWEESVQFEDNSSIVNSFVKSDPRTSRFGCNFSYRPFSASASNDPSIVGKKDRSNRPSKSAAAPQNGGFGYAGARMRPAQPPTTVTNWVTGNGYIGLLAENSFRSTGTAYSDPDGITRHGDGFVIGSANDVTGVNPMEEPASATPEDLACRPVILNRPFRSVGELGYVFRDMPWKTLDLFTPDSADSALLDVFSVSDADMVAGHVNLNTRQTPVLKAIISGAAKTEAGATIANVSAVTNAIAAVTQATPLLNRSELIAKVMSTAAMTTAIGDTVEQKVKSQRETAVRALAETTSTRTWNLMIDVIAQSGRYPASATTTADLKTKFVVEGEKRYWLHVAIDRFTGEVIDQQLEAVYE